MKMLRAVARPFLLVALAVALVIPPWAPVGDAASHREAPAISMDPEADITDFFMFRSYEAGKADKLILIMDVIPGEEPSSGPNYFNFDPNVLYRFEIDNNADNDADDIAIDFKFSTEIRGPVRSLGLPLSYVALPPITALDGAGSEGLGLRQKYSVTFTRRNETQHVLGNTSIDIPSSSGPRVLGENLIAVPSNVGPRTMPNYSALAAQGIYDLGNGVRVFAGQRDDPFYIDLGATFDTLNFRRTPLPLLSAAEDANDAVNPFGVDMLSGFNVNTIAIELPISMITRDGKGPEATASKRIGAYASTSRRTITVLRPGGDTRTGLWVQVQRLANPLVNEVIIGTADKDLWNGVDPDDEGRFLDYYLNPRLATALQLVFSVPAAVSGRTDLANLLLRYNPSDAKVAELLRLDVSTPPVPLADQKRLTVLAGDGAGWPNGRRPKDDVTDVAVRVVGGTNYVNAMAGDGVNVNDKPLPATFPFLADPWDGRNRVHQNP